MIFYLRIGHKEKPQKKDKLIIYLILDNILLKLLMNMIVKSSFNLNIYLYIYIKEKEIN